MERCTIKISKGLKDKLESLRGQGGSLDDVIRSRFGMPPAGRLSKYNFATFEVGDSSTYEGDDFIDSQRLRAACYKFEARSGWKFNVRFIGLSAIVTRIK